MGAKAVTFNKHMDEYANFRAEMSAGRKPIVRQPIIAAGYGARGRGAQIAWTIVGSPFGPIMVAATERGICALSVHEAEEWQEHELYRDFGEAEIRRDDMAVRPTAEAVSHYIEGRPTGDEVPLDVRATPFQLRVWQELLAIPEGATRTYGEIAARIGKPSAARAVGHAVGSNPVAILIPCHRALGSDGRLRGYRWGLEIKKKLLALERRRAMFPG